MNVAIHYFSGTGNTAFAVNRMASLLGEKKHGVSTVFIGRGELPGENFDMHIFAYPVFAWAAPVLVKEYCKKLLPGNGTKAAILSVGGAVSSTTMGFGGQAISQLKSIIRKRGYDVTITDEVYFPDNWIQFTNPPDGEEVEKIFFLGSGMVDEFVRALLRGEERQFKISTFHIIWSKIAAFLFDCVGRRALGKLFVADDQCNECGICAQNCPVGSITIGGTFRKSPQWDFRCEGCNRCMNTCPRKAIQMSWGRAILMLVAIIALLETLGSMVQRVMGMLPAIDSRVLQFLAPYAVGLGIIILTHVLYFTVIDRCIGFLQQIRPLRYFFLLSWTRGFRRYKASGFNPGGK